MFQLSTTRMKNPTSCAVSVPHVTEHLCTTTASVTPSQQRRSRSSAVFCGIPMNKQGRVVISARSRAAHYAYARARVNDGGGSADDGDDAKRDDNNNDDVDVVGNETDTRLPACSRSQAHIASSTSMERVFPAGGARPEHWSGAPQGLHRAYDISGE